MKKNKSGISKFFIILFLFIFVVIIIGFLFFFISILFPKKEDKKEIDQKEIEQEEIEQEEIDKHKIIPISKKNEPEIKKSEPSKLTTREEVVAYHESGHALVMLSLGYLELIKQNKISNPNCTDKITVSIGQPNSYTEGFTESEIPRTISNNELPCYYLQNILIALGGHTSEKLLLKKGKIDKNQFNLGTDYDFYKVNQTRKHLRNKYNPNKFKSNDELIEIIQKTLEQNEKILDEIAKQLLLKKNLNEEDLKKIVDEKGPIQKINMEEVLKN